MDQSLDAVARLMEELGKLPGIGPKSAERMTHFLLAAPRRCVSPWPMPCAPSRTKFIRAGSAST